jgi:hypothetical protein
VGGVAAAYVLTDGPGPPFVTAEGLQLRGGSATPSKVARRSQAWCGSDTSAVDRTPDAVGGADPRDLRLPRRHRHRRDHRHVAVHELAHNLGAVPPDGPPHACPGDDAHICDNENDLMYPYTKGQGLGAQSRSTSATTTTTYTAAWWDLRNSAWLTRLNASQAVLGVSFGKSSGTGSVKSDLPGISCPPGCASPWNPGEKVTLVPSAFS